MERDGLDWAVSGCHESHGAEKLTVVEANSPTDASDDPATSIFFFKDLKRSQF